MAVASVLVDLVLLPAQEADPTQQQGWWRSLAQGIEDFFTVERARDALVVLVAAGIYYWLCRHVKDRMILTPMRVVVAQELTSIARSGVQSDDLDVVVRALQTSGAGADAQEEAILAGLALKRDLAAAARLKELEDLSSGALIAAAVAVKGSLHPPVLALLDKATLSDSEAADLRGALAVVSSERAKSTWNECRFALRRIRKSQSLGVAGLMLIVLLVIMFGNPAVIAFGVLGAMVSRLIAFSRDATDTDRKYNWVVLFLVPIVGGLSAYGGVLLIDAMRTWGLLGETFAGVDFGGEHANVPTMAAAFLFGFVERLLDNVSGNAIDGLGAVAKRQSESDAAAGAAAGGGGGGAGGGGASAPEIQLTPPDGPGPGRAGAGGAQEQSVAPAAAAAVPTAPPPETGSGSDRPPARSRSSRRRKCGSSMSVRVDGRAASDHA
jgi:hypothetical protein